jgi:hypothetical protein
LRALGEIIRRQTKTTTIRFDESGVEFGVEVMSRKFPNGGDCRCHCDWRCRKLRLFEGRPTCAQCIRAAGLRYRIELVSHASKRTALTASPRIAQLNSNKSLRLHPLPKRGLERRALLELALKRSLLVERRAKRRIWADMIGTWRDRHDSMKTAVVRRSSSARIGNTIAASSKCARTVLSSMSRT